MASPVASLTRIGVAWAVVIGCAALPVSAQTAEQLFDSSQLQEVRLFINARDLGELRANYHENTFYPADLQWGGITVRNAGVRSRGGGSRNGSKPGLLVDFDRYVAGQRFVGRRALVLDNLWQDPSMVRERVAMALFDRMGLPAPRESLCRLYINNEYAGVYALVENIDREFLERTLGESGGYLSEYHWVAPYYLQDLGDDLAAYQPLFEPRTREREPASSLYTPIRETIRAINEPSDTLWRSGVERYLDLPQLLSVVAVESFLSELDGLLGGWGVNNLYLYRSDGSSRHRVLPWDRDNAFQSADASVFSRADENALVRRALTFPDLYAVYLDGLERAARLAAENGWLENEVRVSGTLALTAAVNDRHMPYAVEARQEALAHVLDFARRRPGIVLAQVAAARVR
jgi:spore coat protein CotH